MATIAERYNSVSRPQEEEGVRLIDQLSPTENSRVLDVGCGTGYLASVLSERVGPGGEVVGVDPAKERIQLARENHASNHSNLTFMEGRFEDFPEGPYDLIFSNYALHFVKDKDLAFKNAFDNITAGGRFAFNATEKVPKLIADQAEFYEVVAARNKFSLEFKSSGILEIPFPNVDSFLEWTSASTSGAIDHKLADATALADFKKPFGQEPVNLEIPIVTMVFRKPVKH